MLLLTSSWGPSAFAAEVGSNAAAVSTVQQEPESNLEQAKEAIHKGLTNMSESIQLVQYQITEQQFSNLYDAILREDPWLFYVEGCTYHANKNGIVVDMIPRNTVSYTHLDVYKRQIIPPDVVLSFSYIRGLFVYSPFLRDLFRNKVGGFTFYSLIIKICP